MPRKRNVLFTFGARDNKEEVEHIKKVLGEFENTLCNMGGPESVKRFVDFQIIQLKSYMLLQPKKRQFKNIK